MNTNCSVKILIVDDDAVARKILTKMLAKMGFASDVASNGQEALIELGKFPYQLIIMDIQMPVMDGIRATRIIREEKPTRPGIIMISDCDPEIYRDICYEAGADHFLPKSVRMSQLKTAINCCLDRIDMEISMEQTTSCELLA
jgi:DNA-binding response OmpR family regulator